MLVFKEFEMMEIFQRSVLLEMMMAKTILARSMQIMIAREKVCHCPRINRKMLRMRFDIKMADKP